MSEGKCSTLNPLANSFVPGKMTEANTIRGIAEAILKKVVEKESKGESFTSLELANVVGELIVLKYKDSTDINLSKLNSYLSEKILSKRRPLHEKLPTNGSLTYKVDISFDLSKFSPPKLSHLLVSFWGLYRHEQARRPLLSLPYRPEIVKDRIWSIESFDKTLWNRSSVISVCQCPPMFGYTVPPSYFGNPLNISYSCPEQTIHLNHYPETSEGNEFVLTDNFNYNILDEPPFIDEFENEGNIEINLEDLKLQFEGIINGLCALLTKYTEVSEDSLEDDIVEEMICNEEPIDNSDTLFTDGSQKATSIWDDSTIPFVHTETLYSENNEDLDDDSDHPLLEVKNYDLNEGISKEIEEMIRRSLSPKKVEYPGFIVEFEDVEPIERTVICDPPCSVWCNNDCQDKDSTVTEEIKVAHDSISTNPLPQINLLAPEELESKIIQTVPILDLKPTPELSGNEPPRRSFRRSLSVNDCDPYYDRARYAFTGSVAQAAHSTELFKFKFSDTDRNFQQYNRSNSWKDTDSGFVSHCSSQDDLFEKDCREHDERGSMWGLFSGEDSLWKPLPECLTQNRSDDKQVTHKRVRDLRRQRSLN